jgi:hypothetical protein
MVVVPAMRNLSLHPVRQEAIVLAIGLAFYAVYYPIAVWVHRDFSIAQPKGKLVETILRFEASSGGGYEAQVYGNSRYESAVLYEDLTPLGHIAIVQLPSRPESWRFIKMSPRDGSDPRNNGRYYYLVQP